ncbi:hypothetical protein DFR30_2602 [Thiogranum longum]|uniref:Uncharacterized protein n=1 Tax=Thiogranum longum TaxID=1537524 RepID=A0A4R1HPS1_9GAMM|nr:hypothetical protein DFR30_2602 [Thiogranum longum]
MTNIFKSLPVIEIVIFIYIIHGISDYIDIDLYPLLPSPLKPKSDQNKYAVNNKSFKYN